MNRAIKVFLARVVWPLLTTLEVSRKEIKRALTNRRKSRLNKSKLR